VLYVLLLTMASSTYRRAPRWLELGGLGALEELNLAANKIMMVPDAAFTGLTSLKILRLD
jgi:hypothetical protein